MKKIPIAFVLIILVIFACKKSENSTDDESYVKGKAAIYVDESLLPIVEDQEMVFESKYPKKKHTMYVMQSNRKYIFIRIHALNFCLS
jgi:Fe-S cluster assembly iron-binding protein IscA